MAPKSRQGDTVIANGLSDSILLNDRIRAPLMLLRIGQTGLGLSFLGTAALALMMSLDEPAMALWCTIPIVFGLLIGYVIFQVVGVSYGDLTRYRIDCEGLTRLCWRRRPNTTPWRLLSKVLLSGTSSVRLVFRDGLELRLPEPRSDAFNAAVAIIISEAKAAGAEILVAPRSRRSSRDHDADRALLEWEQQVGLRPVLPGARLHRGGEREEPEPRGGGDRGGDPNGVKD